MLVAELLPASLGNMQSTLLPLVDWLNLQLVPGFPKHAIPRTKSHQMDSILF